MLSIPASPHFVGQFLWVEPQERRHFDAVHTEENQFATLPVAPGRLDVLAEDLRVIRPLVSGT